MGIQEPEKDFIPLEIGILGEATAKTQELANAICSMARIAVLHAPYPGQLATGGNLALPLNPPDNPIGPVCRFSIYHLMEVNSPLGTFSHSHHGGLAMTKLKNLAKVIRSKNSGPFEITFDVMFSESETI